MQEKRHAAPARPLFWLAASALVMIAVLIGLALVFRTVETGAEGSATAGEKRGNGAVEGSSTGRSAAGRSEGGGELEQVGTGWWETRRAIYDEIPARVRFRLPETPGGGEKRARELARAIWSEFERLGRVFNAFDPTSELGRLNARAGRSREGTSAVTVSEELARVLEISGTLFEMSSGAFNPTIGPIRELWRAAAESDRPPSEAEIEQARKRVGPGRLRILAAGKQNRMVVLPPGGVQLDLGAIAKGYAVDRVRAMLRERGVSSALVVLGGDIGAFGDKDGRPWRIGIQHPRDDRAVWGTVDGSGELRVSTSGNYRQPIAIGGRVYYHIFDPRTGRPVPTRVEGVTTLDVKGRASNALLDGMATTITVLGPEAGLKLTRELGIEALVLLSEGEAKNAGLREIMTEGFRAVYRPKGGAP
jgi:thiamine biosynthesis lipoprotein